MAAPHSSTSQSHLSAPHSQSVRTAMACGPWCIIHPFIPSSYIHPFHVGMSARVHSNTPPQTHVTARATTDPCDSQGTCPTTRLLSDGDTLLLWAVIPPRPPPEPLWIGQQADGIGVEPGDTFYVPHRPYTHTVTSADTCTHVRCTRSDGHW